MPKQADATLAEWQKALPDGSYLTFHSQFYGYPIYGLIVGPIDERWARSFCPYDRKSELYAYCFPMGKFGNLRLSEIERLITEPEFDRARDLRWRFP